MDIDSAVIVNVKAHDLPAAIMVRLKPTNVHRGTGVVTAEPQDMYSCTTYNKHSV